MFKIKNVKNRRGNRIFSKRGLAMRKITTSMLTLFMLLGIAAVTFDLQAQTRAYRVSDRAVGNLLNRIETRTDRFKRSLDNALDRSVINNTQREDNIIEYITEFENSTDQLKQKFDAKESVSEDVRNVLTRAAYINNFMKNNRLSAGAQRDWGYLRTDLNMLANYYSVSYDWNAAVNNNTAVYTRPYRVSDSNVQTLLTKIESQTDNFKRTLSNALDRSTLNNTESEDMIIDYVTAFENSTDRLKQRFDAKESVSSDVEDVLGKAAAINGFMNSNRLGFRTERIWANLRADLNILANYYSVSWDWNRVPTTPANNALAFTVASANVQRLLTSLESKTDAFKRSMNTALDRSVLNNTRSEDALVEYITAFENATDRLKQNFDAQKSTDEDVEEVLNRAAFIDTFMRDYRLLNTAERQWMSIKNDLNTLSNYYAVNWNWNRQYQPMTRFDSMLTGTYRINAAMSDNVDAVVENAIRLYPAYRENAVEERLKERLAAPEVLVIQKNNMDITVASTNAPQITFRADGVARNERTAAGRTVKISSNTSYDGVSVNYEGDRMNDFYVNFMPMSDGRLRVVRRINVVESNDTVTVASVYDKVSETAQWNMADRNYNNVGDNNMPANMDFVIPNGTRISAVLRNSVSTKDSQDGDRFTMEVTSPSQFSGAIIEGRVIKPERSGNVTGRANVSLDFDSIRLRNGQTYRFAGIIENVTLADGEQVAVNNEGVVRDNNQTNKTITRAGIGAGVGAILGAILGGGKGAAIGAAIGGAAGAGTVIAQGRDDVELGQGTQFTITATAPNSVGSSR